MLVESEWSRRPSAMQCYRVSSVILSEAKEPKPDHGSFASLRMTYDTGTRNRQSYLSARLRNASRPALIASQAQITPKT